MTLQLASRWSSEVAAMAHWMMWTMMPLLSKVTGLLWTNLEGQTDGRRTSGDAVTSERRTSVNKTLTWWPV